MARAVIHELELAHGALGFSLVDLAYQRFEVFGVLVRLLQGTLAQQFFRLLLVATLQLLEKVLEIEVGIGLWNRLGRWLRRWLGLLLGL